MRMVNFKILCYAQFSIISIIFFKLALQKILMNSYQSNTLCKKCNQFIKTQHFLVHNERCKGGRSSFSRDMSSSRSSSRLANSRMKTQFVQQQTIPCHFCSYPQTLAQLDSHPFLCEHRQQECARCHNQFPKSLMRQHQVVCPAQESQEEEDEDYEMSQQQYDHRHPHNMFLRGQNSPFQFMARMLMPQSSPLRSHSQRSGSSHRSSNRPEGQRIIMINRIQDLIRLLAGGLHGQEGLEKQEIQKFPVNKFMKKNRKEGEQDMCIICYCQFQQGQMCMTLPCKHIFHPQCVSTWLQKNPTCPVCKHKYGPKRKQQQEDEQNSDRPRQRRLIFRF